MVGYGPEDSQFVLELTYNYEVKEYQQGNDFQHIRLDSQQACSLALLPGLVAGGGPGLRVESPGGYSFLVADADVAPGSSVITELCLAVSSLDASLAYWRDFLGFHLLPPPGSSHDAPSSQAAGEAVLSCGSGQAVLRLRQLQPPGTAVERGTAFGRVAFSTPGHLLQQLEADVKAAGYTVHTPYVSLDTPGKASVQVVILQDPDGHEICFVGEEGFRELSQVDPKADQLLEEAVAADKSAEWLAKRAAREAAMAAKGV
ncbi:VOC domain-containing protein [Haematococcus lacustris]|uniref:VOC domain-containing protein n=1 Tax=Haematococcus lacustris TaxID=44745 RepID=A0A699YLY4_HAELA|nr:VOC domain-containing protein [Haematococcus lacustris]